MKKEIYEQEVDDCRLGGAMSIENRYIVVTPCRNEEKNLLNLLQSITVQTIRPALWVVVDDGSTDKTGELIAEAGREYEWIKGIQLEKNKEYMGTHVAHVCNKGFVFAEEYCNARDISYEYIALVDADNILEKGYFEKLIVEFKKDEKLGIASGDNMFADIERVLDELKTRNQNITVMDERFWQMWDNNTTVNQKSREDLPMGSARLWRKECFEETRGYLPVPLPDSVSNAMAKLKGWKTRRFFDTKVIERQGLKKQGLWNGYKEKGESYFILGQSFHIALLKALKYTFKRPYYIGIAYLYGYIASFVCGKEKVKDDEIRYYYKRIHKKELRTYYKDKMKKLLGK